MLLRLFGYTRPIPLHDHTNSRESLRSIEHSRSGDPLGDPTFVRHVDHVTDADERARKTERILRTRRTWAGVAALLALAIAPPPTPASAATCPPGHGSFARSLPTPDGSRLVCGVDVVAGKYELFSVGTAATVRLSPDMADDRDTIWFEISPDSRYVAFACDRTKWTAYDLYTVPVGGGTPVKVNKPLPLDHDVDDFRWSGDRLVWRQGRNTVGLWALYSAPATGGQVLTLSPPMPPGAAVQRGFQILDGHRVRYSANPDASATFRWFVVPVTGGRTLTELFVDGFEGGSTGAWA